MDNEIDNRSQNNERISITIHSDKYDGETHMIFIDKCLTHNSN